MFDFEKLEIYKRSKLLNYSLRKFMIEVNLDSATRYQLRRASLSIVLNIAEGSGRRSKSDKRHFFVMSRGSLFECVAILDILKDEEVLNTDDFTLYYRHSEILSKMLLGTIKSLE
jgi:four helix bundle protein